MIKFENRRAWFFYEPDQPVAVTIYNPVTEHNQFLVIIEEPTEGGPDISTKMLNKTLVAAAFGISNEEAGIHQGYVEEYDGYDVNIEQVLKDMTGRYFIGFLTKLESGQWTHSNMHNRTFISRREAVNVLLSGKTILECVGSIECDLPF